MRCLRQDAGQRFQLLLSAAYVLSSSACGLAKEDTGIGCVSRATSCQGPFCSCTGHRQSSRVVFVFGSSRPGSRRIAPLSLNARCARALLLAWTHNLSTDAGTWWHSVCPIYRFLRHPSMITLAQIGRLICIAPAETLTQRCLLLLGRGDHASWPRDAPSCRDRKICLLRHQKRRLSEMVRAWKVADKENSLRPK
jgi:hypothetical protein